MRNLLLSLVIVLVTASTVYSYPFLLCDPVPEAVGGRYIVVEGTTEIVTVDSELDGSVVVDVAPFPLGSHSYAIYYIVNSQESYRVEFTIYKALSYSKITRRTTISVLRTQFTIQR